MPVTVHFEFPGERLMTPGVSRCLTEGDFKRRILSARERLHHKDFSIGLNRDIELISLTQHFAINEHGDVFTNRALIVQHVTTQLGMLGEHGFQRFVKRRRVNGLASRTFDVLSKL